MAASSGGRGTKPNLPEPRGGAQQKRKWSQPPPEDIAESKLAAFLLDQWSWGCMSAPMIQKIAAAGLHDGARHPDVAMIAGLGSNGQHEQNINSELLRALVKNHVSAALHPVDVHVKKTNGSFFTKATNHILLPHSLFATLYHHHRDAFEYRILGRDKANITRFWNDMRKHPNFANHPFRDDPASLARCVPIGWHGDGVAFAGLGKSWSKSMVIYSWCSMIGSGNTAMTNFAVFMFQENSVIKAGGMNLKDKMWVLVCWSFNWLLKGVWPDRDHLGNMYKKGTPEFAKRLKPLAGGFKAHLWSIRADLEHMASGFGQPWPTSGQPCICCKANSTDLPFTDGRPTALWQANVWSAAQWSEAHPDCHPIFKLDGVTILSFTPDVMHTLHLGCYTYAFGSILCYLTHHFLMETPEKNLEVVWSLIKNAYKDKHMYRVCHACPIRMCSELVEPKYLTV